MSARSPLIPEGWKVKAGAVVVVEPSKDDPAPPTGVWKVLDKAPGVNAWWLMALDDVAKEWAARRPDQATSGCVNRPSRVLVPRGYRRARPADLQEPGR